MSRLGAENGPLCFPLAGGVVSSRLPPQAQSASSYPHLALGGRLAVAKWATFSWLSGSVGLLVLLVRGGAQEMMRPHRCEGSNVRAGIWRQSDRGGRTSVPA
jgi:hypothetical protein